MANNKNFVVKNGIDTGDGYDMPNRRPDVMFDFAGTKTLHPDMTFDRNTIGTYYDGVTMVRSDENRIAQAASINYNRGSASGNQTAPTGNSETYCYLYTENSDGSSHDIYHYLSTGYVKANETFTASVYVKANGRNFVTLSVATDSSNYIYAHANLSTGAITETNDNGTGNYDSSSITNIGGSWYRISVTGDLGSNQPKFVFTAGADSATPSISGDYGRDSYTGDGTSGWYVYGYQIERRSTVSAYVDTGSYAIATTQPKLQTALANHARFDHDPVTGESKGLLIEEARTNLLANSTLGGYYTYSSTYKHENSAIAPDGTATATTLYSTGNLNVYKILNNPGTGDYTISVFAKKADIGDENIFGVYLYNSGGSNAFIQWTDFNLADGTIETKNAAGTNGDASTITDVGNGWYRLSVTGNLSTDDNLSCGVAYVSPSDADAAFLVWGAQVEKASFHTSFIPTSGSTVQRNQDNCSITSDVRSDLFRLFNDEATLYAEAYAKANNDANMYPFTIGAGSVKPRIALYVDNSGNAAGGHIRIDDGTYTAAFTTGTYVADALVKVAMSYNHTSADFAANGSSPSTDTTMALPFELATSLSIGNPQGSNVDKANTHIAKIAFYSTKLTRDELIELTGA